LTVSHDERQTKAMRANDDLMSDFISAGEKEFRIG
jgi:hypothetical protein